MLLLLYADDVCLLSRSCFALQKMLDICSRYGVKWDILFNPAKSHMVTFGSNNPEVAVQLNNKTIGWSLNVKYLSLYLTGGANFRIYLNADASIILNQWYVNRSMN